MDEDGHRRTTTTNNKVGVINVEHLMLILDLHVPLGAKFVVRVVLSATTPMCVDVCSGRLSNDATGGVTKLTPIARGATL